MIVRSKKDEDESMRMDRMAGCALLLGSLAAGSALAAQSWTPQKNIELVVPNAPGGTNDKLARVIERTFTGGKLVTTSVSVTNRAGGGGQIAYGYLAQHPGDPHLLAIGTPTLLTAHITGSSKLSHNDLTLVASIFNDYIVLAVNEASPVKSGQELVTRMRKSAPTMTLGFSSALGNHHHIAAGLFMKAIGANVRDLKPVIFKGSSEALTALLGNHIQMVSTGAGNAVPHAAAGKLRILGVSAGQRLPGPMASVPTWKEQGVNLVYGSWRAIVAPKGLTPEQVGFWEAALKRVTESPEWKTELERNFWTDDFATGVTLKKNIDQEHAESKAVLAELGLVK
jgi:putative tricarboxylic transport membrane protein